MKLLFFSSVILIFIPNINCIALKPNQSSASETSTNNKEGPIPKQDEPESDKLIAKSNTDQIQNNHTNEATMLNTTLISPIAKPKTSLPVTNPKGQAQEDSSGSKTVAVLHNSSLSTGAALRGFYAMLAIGVIVLLFISIKALRLRRRRAARKYRVLSRNDDQEMFPLAADDGDDDEIFNAANILPGEMK